MARFYRHVASTAGSSRLFNTASSTAPNEKWDGNHQHQLQHQLQPEREAHCGRGSCWTSKLCGGGGGVWVERAAAWPRRVQVLALAAAGLSIMGITSATWTSFRPYPHRPPPPQHHNSWPPTASYSGPLACDPFSRPGFLSFSPEHPHDASWVPFDSRCPPAPDYLAALRAIREVGFDENEATRERMIRSPRRRRSGEGEGREAKDLWGRPYPDLTFLRDKSALIVGDSVDRNSLEHLHELVHAHVRNFPYGKFDSPPEEGWDPRGTPWLVNVGMWGERNRTEESWMDGMAKSTDKGGDFAGLGFGVINSFLYGMDDIDEFAAQADWHPPGLAEARIERLVIPTTTQMSRSNPNQNGPVFISLHSGLWDLAFFGRRDRERNQTTGYPLTVAQMEWWMGRMRSVVKMLKGAYPETPIWLRGLHRVGDNYWASHDWSPGLKHGMGEGFVNFFTDIRIHQIREMQLYVAQEEGLPIFDFGHMWEGYQALQDKVHPNRDPGGTIINQALLHHIWMESIGRENWDAEARKWVKPLPHVLQS